jgi:hypothetical protein
MGNSQKGSREMTSVAVEEPGKKSRMLAVLSRWPETTNKPKV